MGNLCMLNAAESGSESWWQKEESVSVCLMKRIADNPHDEHLGAEIAEGSWRDFLSTSQHKLPPRDQIRI